PVVEAAVAGEVIQTNVLCARRVGHEQVGEASSSKSPQIAPVEKSHPIHDDINPRRRLRGSGRQDVVGRVPSRGTFGVVDCYRCLGLFEQEATEHTEVAERTKTRAMASLASGRGS